MNLNATLLVVIAASAIFYGTPLLFASVGELLAERSGVLNLGVEGMMLVGAVSAFWTVQHLHGPDWVVLSAAVLVAALAATATSLIHAVRAVGESPETADAMGVNVAAYRYAHTLIGGALAGVGGAYFSLAISPNWVDGMTSGAGWIAIALVIFAFWRPELALVGAYLFGAFSSLAFTLQARQVHLPPEVFNSLPYLMTIVVLVFVSTGWAKRRLGAPASLGVPYVREER